MEQRLFIFYKIILATNNNLVYSGFRLMLEARQGDAYGKVFSDS